MIPEKEKINKGRPPLAPVGQRGRTQVASAHKHQMRAAQGENARALHAHERTQHYPMREHREGTVETTPRATG